MTSISVFVKKSDAIEKMTNMPFPLSADFPCLSIQILVSINMFYAEIYKQFCFAKTFDIELIL